MGFLDFLKKNPPQPSTAPAPAPNAADIERISALIENRKVTPESQIAPPAPAMEQPDYFGGDENIAHSVPEATPTDFLRDLDEAPAPHESSWAAPIDAAPAVTQPAAPAATPVAPPAATPAAPAAVTPAAPPAVTPAAPAAVTPAAPPTATPAVPPTKMSAIDLPDFTDEDFAMLEPAKAEPVKVEPKPVEKPAPVIPAPEVVAPVMPKKTMQLPAMDNPLPTPHTFAELEPAQFLSGEGYFLLVEEFRNIRRVLRRNDDVLRDATIKHEQADDQIKRTVVEINTIQERLMELDGALFEQ